MKTSKLQVASHTRVGAAVLAALHLTLLLPATAHAQSSSSTDMVRRQSQYASVQQAVYQLVAEAGDTLDSDGTYETPAMKLGTGDGPADGGVIPDASGAPKTDGFAGVLGYCAWDNGAATAGVGYLAGAAAANIPALAVISYGLDNTFQTTCADARLGVTQGDDYVFSMTVNQMVTGASATVSTYWGAPVATEATLATLDPSTLHDGEARLTRDSNQVFRWTAGSGTWDRVSFGALNWVDVGGADARLAGKAAVGQTALGSEQLLVNGGANTALGLMGTGATTGVSIYNTAGSAVNAFLGYDNTNSKLVLSAQTGGLSVQLGGAERVAVAADGALSLNGVTVFDASRNLTAAAGTFSGALSGASLGVGGTTVIDAARNVGNVGSVTATGAISGASFAIGGTPVIDNTRAASLSSLTTSGAAVIGGTLTVGGDLTAPLGSTATLGNANVQALTVSGGANFSGGNFILSGANIRGTLAARPAAGVANRLYVTTDTNEIYRDTGAAWVRLGAGALASLTDMAISGPVAGQTLIYDAATAKWKNALLTAGNGISITPANGAITIGLPNVGTAGTYGSATQAPVLTTDAQGRITGVVNTTITPAWANITGKPTTVAGYGITDAGIVNYAVNMNQNVRTTDSPTFAGVTAGTFKGTLANEDAGVRVVAPQGAAYAGTGGNQTGALRIALPTTGYNSNTMLQMTVHVYEYSTGKSRAIRVGGYNYATGWLNTFAYGMSGDALDLNVRFGNDGTRNVIWIGETNTVWVYPRVFVTDFQGGHSNATAAKWATGWGVTFAAALDTVQVGPTQIARMLTNTSAPYAAALNQHLRTTDSPTFAGVTATTFTGALSGNAATATKLATARTLSMTGDGTWSVSFDGSGNATAAMTLANSGATAASYGSATAVPVLTVDAKGRITAASTAAINSFATAMNQNVRTTDSPTFAGVTATTFTGALAGNATTATSSPLLSALGNYVWTAATLPTGYNMGTQTSFVSAGEGFQSYGSLVTTRTYWGGGGSLQMYVPYSPTYGGTGLQVRFGNYDVSSGNSWTGWKTLLASDNFNTYAPTLTGTGASGTWGIGITGNAATATKLATARTLSMTGDGTWSVSFDGSGNATAAMTLANSGVTAGSYGSATMVPAITVDAKGRVTAVTNTTITPAWSSITGKPTTLAGYLGSDSVGANPNVRLGSGFYENAVTTTANGWPVNGGWYHLLSTTHSNTGNYYAMQFAGDFGSQDVYYRSTGGSGATAWSKMLHAGNSPYALAMNQYVRTSDAPTFAGLTANGTIYATGSITGTNTSSGTISSMAGYGGLEARGNGTGAAVMSFHRPGVYAAYLGLDTDNQLKYGGWSFGTAAYVLHSGNAAYAWNMNQYVRTTDAPTFAGVYNNEWFRNNNAGQGMYNQATAQYLYSESASYWRMSSGNGMKFYANDNATMRGYVYHDTTGFGLLNNGGNWAIRANFGGASAGGSLYGTWDATNLTIGGQQVVHAGNVGSYAMPVNGGVNANFDIASNQNDSGFGGATIELRELNHGGALSGALSEAPRLGFHWGGRVASQLALNTDGTIMVRDNPGTGYEKFAAGNITANGTLTASGNLTLTAANPYIYSGSSYIVVPNGMYFSGGTVYIQNQMQARGGVNNDTGNLTLSAAGGTIVAAQQVQLPAVASNGAVCGVAGAIARDAGNAAYICQ